MLADVNIIVGCTARKTVVPPPEYQLRSIQCRDTVARAKRWIAHLKNASERKIPAIDLYAGDAWQILKPFAKTHRLWIASAGYGFIHSQTSLCSYSATFAKRHPDSVMGCSNPDRNDREDFVWWTELGKWKKHDQPAQHIADLARLHPGTPILVVLSPEYLRALERDLFAAREFLLDPMRLVIVSAGAHKTGALADHFLPCDARLQTQLGGARASLNARIARKILTETAPDRLHMGELNAKFTRLLARNPQIVTRKRILMQDHEVTAFLAKQLQRDPKVSHSRLLFQLRDDGFACEQNRFKRLFKKSLQHLR